MTVLLWTTPLDLQAHAPVSAFLPGPSHLFPLPEDHQAMDYDAYDALLHHIFRQVHRLRRVYDFESSYLSPFPV